MQMQKTEKQIIFYVCMKLSFFSPPNREFWVFPHLFVRAISNRI